MEQELKFDWKNIYSVFVIDDLYEHINAPQWVDFSSSEIDLLPPPDDHLWFCRPECNHPKTAQDFLKQLPCPKDHNCHHDDEVKDSSNLNRRRTLKKGSTKCDDESDCENHNPNLSTSSSSSSSSTKQHKVLSSNNFFASSAAAGGDRWQPITEFFYKEFKKKLTIRTKTAQEKKNPLLLFDSVKEKPTFLPRVKTHFIRLVKRRSKDAHNHPHQNKLIKFNSSSSRSTILQVGGGRGAAGGILQELEDDQCKV